MTYKDQDGDAGRVVFRWIIDGVQVRGKVHKNVASGTTLTDELDSRYTDSLDKVKVIYIANDGKKNLKKTSEEVIIQSDSSTTVVVDKTEINSIIALLEQILVKLKAWAS